MTGLRATRSSIVNQYRLSDSAQGALSSRVWVHLSPADPISYQPYLQAGIAIVASGHDLNHSLRHADRVWLMHQGRVVSQGGAREVLTAERLEPLYQAEFVQLETPQGPLLYLP